MLVRRSPARGTGPVCKKGVSVLPTEILLLLMWIRKNETGLAEGPASRQFSGCIVRGRYGCRIPRFWREFRRSRLKSDKARSLFSPLTRRFLLSQILNHFDPPCNPFRILNAATRAHAIKSSRSVLSLKSSTYGSPVSVKITPILRWTFKRGAFAISSKAIS